MKRSYIIDLFKSLFRAKNLPAMIYLVLNVQFILAIFLSIFGRTTAVLEFALVVYLVAVVIGLSPVGESLLRTTHGCKKIENVEMLNRLEPLFMEVKERALSKHAEFHIHPKTRLYFKEDSDVNAFAVGRRTICVTTGLLALSDDEIKAVLGHEFGHLATHDTDLILLISVGNMIVSIVTTIFKFVIIFFKIILSFVGSLVGGSEGTLTNIVSAAAGFMIMVFVDCVMYIWTKFGVWLVMTTSREAEYEADAFSCNLGYTDGLLSFFYGLAEEERLSYGVKDGGDLFAAFSASHPATKKRIENIRNGMGVVEN